MSCTAEDPPVHLFNNEACSLEVSLLTGKEVGGKQKITPLKREDQNGEDMGCPAA